MQTSVAQLAAWKVASADLGFNFVNPFTLVHDGRDFLFFCHLPQFGSKAGMLVLTEYDAAQCHAASSRGFGYACISEANEPYNRQDFIELLNDWSWSSDEPPPPWMSSTPSSS